MAQVATQRQLEMCEAATAAIQFLVPLRHQAVVAAPVMRLAAPEPLAVLGVAVATLVVLVDRGLLIKVLLAGQLPVLRQIIPAVAVAAQVVLVSHRCRGHLLVEMAALVLLRLLQVHMLLEQEVAVALLKLVAVAMVVMAAVAMAAPELVELGKAVQLTPAAAAAPDMSVQAQEVRV